MSNHKPQQITRTPPSRTRKPHQNPAPDQKEKEEETSFDILIIGAGPAGLSLARRLQQETHLRIALIERTSRPLVTDPQPDGRDLAISLEAQDMLRTMGVWQKIAEDEISPLYEARVVNGASSYFLGFFTQNNEDQQEIGHFVPNHCIRRALWQTISEQQSNEKPPVTVIFDTEVERVGQREEAGRLFLKDGSERHAALIVAADSRFSSTRESVGIATHRLDFARTCIVARVEHAYSHANTAYECFMGSMTLAVLPLNHQCSSIVLTLPPDQAREAMEMSPECFAAYIARSFQHRLGEMKLVSDRRSYPLVATYASRFYADRFALIGDAAVGMHPVTAHGYNFGLKGAWRLAEKIKEAAALGLDVGNQSVVRPYSRTHRNTTLPLFLATNSIVQLYASTSPLARKTQTTLLHLGQNLAPVRNLLVRHLTKRLSSKNSH